MLAAPSPTNNAGATGSFSGTTTTTTVSSTSTTTTSTTSTSSTSTTSTSLATTGTLTTSTSTTTLMPTTTTGTPSTTSASPTTTSASTTTLPPESSCPASIPAACDDGDACSIDRCVAGTGCVHDPVAGPGDLIRIGPACAGQPVPPAVGQQFARGCGMIETAKSQSAKKAGTLLTRATRALGRAAKTAARAGTRKKDPISADCAAALRAALGGARNQAQRAKTGL
jgi:hypothetical protein